MSRVLYFDCFSGIAGDMTVGALLDAGLPFADLEGALETAIAANRPYVIDVRVDREIRPVGTGTWELPPIPHGEPNFRKLAGLDK